MPKKTKKPTTKQDFPINTIVEILWEDACSLSGWDNIETYKNHTAMPVKSVGYLIKRNKKCITLAGTQALDEGFCQGITIPLSWMKQIRTLQKGKK